MEKYYILLTKFFISFLYFYNYINASDILINTNKTSPYILNSDISHNFIVNQSGSLIIKAGMNELNKSNAITITNSPKFITNYGKIISNLVDSNYDKSTIIEYDKGYAIFISNGDVKNNSFINNYGDIISNLNIVKGNQIPTKNDIGIRFSGNSAYININENIGIILANVDMQAGDSYSDTGKASSSAKAEWTGIAVHGKVNNNDGLIMSNLIFKAGNVTSTSHTNKNSIYCINTDTCAPMRINYSGNALAGDITLNKAYIISKADVAGGNVQNNISGSYGTAEAFFRESGNAVLGNVENNKGFIYTSTNILGGKASAIDHIGGTYQVYSRGSSNGVYGLVNNNEGIISGSAILEAQSTDVPKASIFIEDRLSANGVYGAVKKNSGIIRGFVEYKAGTKLDEPNPIYSYYSGNGIAFKNATSVNTLNEGLIIGKNSAISINDKSFDNAKFDNYGLLVGQKIFSHSSSDGLSLIDITPLNAKNYGTYLKIDSSGNIINIIQAQNEMYNGKQIIQAPIYSGRDAYKIYNNNSIKGITNTIINGIGNVTGALTLSGFSGDFKIDSSIVNAYYTAISYNDSRIITLNNSIVNGGGLKGDIPIIQGDDSSNGLLAIGNTIINGNISLGKDNDIFIFDYKNAEINGRVDLGEGSKDTFALYEFSGTGEQLLPIIKREIFHGRANSFLGSKVTGLEYIGLQKGLLNLYRPNNYTQYGLYIGSGTKVTLENDQNYTLKGLLNFGRLSFIDGFTNDNLTVLGDAYLSGIIEKDTNLNTLKSDNITVLGKLAGNTKFYIAGIGNKRPSTIPKVLITAPNDNDRTDEYFSFVKKQRYRGEPRIGRFNNSPHPWYLLSLDNQWILSPINEGGNLGSGGEGGGIDGENSNGGDGNNLGNIGENIDSGDNTDTDNINGGNIGNGNTNDLGKIEILAEIPAYISLMNISRELAKNEIGILYNRLDRRRHENSNNKNLNSWIKGNMHRFSFDEGNILDLSGKYGGLNIGVDKKSTINKHWSSFLGLSFGYKSGDFETKEVEGKTYITKDRAKIDVNSLSIGTYGVIFNQDKNFVDFALKYLYYTSNIDVAGLQVSTNGYMALGSLGTGYKFDLDENWLLEPRIQLDLGYIHWNKFNDGFNNIHFDNQYLASTKAGIRAEKIREFSTFKLKTWAYMGVDKSYTNKNRLYFSYDEFIVEENDFKSEFEAGIVLWEDRDIELYLEGKYSTNFDNYEGISGDIGLRFTW